MAVAMQFDTLIFETRERIAHITLNRPDRLNALSDPMVEDLRRAAVAIESNRDVRAVLLTGAGRAFCAGADLSGDGAVEVSPGQPVPGSTGERIRASMQKHFNPMIDAWYHLRVPVVVAVNGVAAGAGVSLALQGDIVLAAKSAKFIELFAPKLGLMPDLGSTYFLPRLVGTARAKGLTLLGDALSAPEAAEWGLIWACVDDADLHPRAQSIAQRLASGPTQAYQRIKTVFNVEPPNTLAEQLALEAEHQAVLGDTQDFAEGVAAFRSKRAPNFSGG
jgi:2-(1,2-epoxy-1,2-dihydrophenyl)acetyl-CoA isomerase